MENWLERWQQDRIGWHEAHGNNGLRQYWPRQDGPAKVLVPLCGKSIDLLWLAGHGAAITGIELSPIAAQAFFSDNNLDFEVESSIGFDRYRATGAAIQIYCGDYLTFVQDGFDGLYDRGALVAMPANQRMAYVAHTKSLLCSRAYRLIVTLEYDQQRVDGPPYAVWPDEIQSYWSDLSRLGERDDFENCPPKFHDAGLTDVKEVFWASQVHS